MSDAGVSSRNNATIKCAAVLLCLAWPVVVWWLVGPQVEHPDLPPGAVAPEMDTYDYMFMPPRFGPVAERSVAWACVFAVAASLLVIGKAFVSRRLDRRWALVLVALLAVGTVVGWGERILTAAVFGANIGGGLVLLFGGPLVAALLVAAAARSMWIIRSR